MKFNKVIKEANKKFTTRPTQTGDTDLSPSADYGSFTSATIIPPEKNVGYEATSAESMTDNQWNRSKNKFTKMDWEQPEPNPSDFAASDVQDVANDEINRLSHNKSSYKQAYKKHEVPDDKSMARLVKMDDKVNSDPLFWKSYKSTFSPNKKGKY